MSSSTKMEHKCTVEEKSKTVEKLKWYQKYIMISFDNPLRLSYFRSDISVKEEQTRQLKVNKFAIHPFSKFRAWYEVYLIFLYGAVLTSKPMDAGFVRFEDCWKRHYIYYNVFVDILCWIDIALNFVTGYEHTKIHMIELRRSYIIKHYLFGPYFICDVVSSIPKCVVYYLLAKFTRWYSILRLSGVSAISGMFKAIRIISFVKCIWRTADYFRMTTKGIIFLICTMFGSYMIVHWIACMQFAIPRLWRINFSKEISYESWFFSKKIYGGALYRNHSILVRYNQCLFKSSSQIFGHQLMIYEMKLPEEYLLAMFTFFIGKVLVGFIWIVLVVTILNARIMEVKFVEIINQLQEYMRQKQLPMDLQDRILQHFFFKYQKKYFEEELITSLLSENLKKEANMHTCKSLIENVSLFRDLSPVEISKVVSYLIPEIFLPNDTIIQAGTQGEAMYFLASGTVAVYTRSGKEICHLQDGAYFGEISLVIKGQLRSATIKVLETSYIYRLNKKDLERCLLKNKTVMHKILRNAEDRLKEASKCEEEYKEQLFEQSFRKISSLR